MKNKILRIFLSVNLAVLAMVVCLFVFTSCKKAEQQAEPKVEVSETELSLKEGEEYRLTARSNNGEIAVWSSSDENIVGVVDGVVNAYKEGKAKITVAFGEAYASCDIRVIKRVLTADELIVISSPSVGMKVGEKTKLSAFIYNQKGNISWESDNSEIVEVDAKGELTALRAGTATVTAFLKGLSDSCEVTVSDNIEIILDKPTEFLLCNTNKKLEFALYLNGKKASSSLLAWATSDPYVADVEEGVLNVKNDGAVTITASFEGVSSSVDYEVKRTISTVDDFKNITKTGRYILSNDIDFHGKCIPCVAPYSKTKPDGADSTQILTSNMFEGNIDGNGYSLYNVNPWSGISGDNFHSLLGCIGQNGVVKNLSVYARTSTSGGMTAPIAFCNLGLVENVYSELTLYRDGINTNNQNAGLIIDNRGTVKNCISRLKVDSTMEGQNLLYSAVSFGKLIRNCTVENCLGISDLKDVKLIGQMGNTSSYSIKVSASELYTSDNDLLANASLKSFDIKVWQISFTQVPLLKKNYLGV